jgi:hypothetical protein
MSLEEMRRMLKMNHPAPTAVPPAAPRSIREPLHGIRPIPGIPAGFGEQRYIHFPLPGGITLVAPENLDGQDRQRLNQLLQAARQIFTGLPFVYMESGQSPFASKGAGDAKPEEEE